MDVTYIWIFKDGEQRVGLDVLFEGGRSFGCVAFLCVWVKRLDSAVQKEMVQELKREWRRLWQERIDDKVKAEGIAERDYSDLFVDRGTVIVATRDFKALDFREILRLHRFSDLDRVVGPSPVVGGWGKFIRTFVAGRKASGRVAQARSDLERNKRRQQLKKNGRGWLHA